MLQFHNCYLGIQLISGIISHQLQKNKKVSTLSFTELLDLPVKNNKVSVRKETYKDASRNSTPMTSLSATLRRLRDEKSRALEEEEVTPESSTSRL